MPEAFAILLVFVVSLAAYIAARVQTSNPAHATPVADLQRLREHRAWLDERLNLAWRERWDQEMIARLADEIDAVDSELARRLALIQAARKRNAA